MVIIGIDPGLANTGWGVVETRGSLARARAYGCIHTDADTPLNLRLGTICAELSDVISTYGPQSVAIEDIFFGQNTRSAILTAQARGAALVACAQCGVDVGSYTPMQIKQAIVGTGAADKHQVTFMVRHVLALDHDPKPDHCADALAAAVCHAHLSRTFASSSARGGDAARTLVAARSSAVASSEHQRHQQRTTHAARVSQTSAIQELHAADQNASEHERNHR